MLHGDGNRELQFVCEYNRMFTCLYVETHENIIVVGGNTNETLFVLTYKVNSPFNFF